MNNQYDNDEPNVEGLVSEFASRMPWDDPQACYAIRDHFAKTIDFHLANRAARKVQEATQQEEGEDD